MKFKRSEYEILKCFEKYSFKVIDVSEKGHISICLVKDNKCITYHRWPQFGDFNVFVTDTIDDFLNHKYSKIYGQDWFMENIYPKYEASRKNKKWEWIDLVEFYLQQQIGNHNKIFDIQFNF